MGRHVSRRLAILLATLTLALGIPLGIVIASHQYGDVPNSNPFHADISAITNAGVTSGCGGGNYCPDRNVTRAEMAAFMNRLGALAANKTPVVNATKVDGWDSTSLLPGGTLPYGRTLKGSFGIIEYTADYYQDTISFGYRLLTEPTVHYISDGDPVPAGCSGSAANPGASPGHLCVFESGTQNMTAYDCIWHPISFFCGHASREGFGISQLGASDSQWYAIGTWAVTGGALPLLSDDAPPPAGDGSTAFGP